MLKDVSFVLHSSRQRQNWPTWGLYLDHLVHGVDLAAWLAAAEISGVSFLSIKSWRANNGQIASMQLLLHTNNKGQRITVEDRVSTSEMGPKTCIIAEDRCINLSIHDEMFHSMWRAFLAWDGQGPSPITLEEGIRANEVLRQGRKCLKGVV